MEVGGVLVLLTILLPVVAIYTTRTTPKSKDIGEIPDISKKYKIKPGHRVEPVISEPQNKMRLSRSTYKVNSRIQNQYMQLRKKAFKLDSMYKSTHEKFLRAIDHMEFHPTLGRPKEKPEVRLKRQAQKGSR